MSWAEEFKQGLKEYSERKVKTGSKKWTCVESIKDFIFDSNFYPCPGCGTWYSESSYKFEGSTLCPTCMSDYKK